jgi:hypothetical protein
MPWELIARQTASDASPTSAQPSSSWATLGDSSATQNFSILDKLATKYGGGPYTLKMRWPELNSGKGGENAWVQSSLPDATLGRGVKATGYREIDIEYPGCFWAGLQRCDGPAGPAYICSLAANGNWWYPMGTSASWNAGASSFPGACESGTNGHTVHKVELWLWAEEQWGWSFLLFGALLATAYVGGGVWSGGGRGWDKAALQSHPHWSNWIALRGLCQDGLNFARGGGGAQPHQCSASAGSSSSSSRGDPEAGGGDDGRSRRSKSSKASSSRSSDKASSSKHKKAGKRSSSERAGGGNKGDDAQTPLLADAPPVASGSGSGSGATRPSSGGYRGDEWSSPKVQLQSGARETGVKVKY